VSLPFDDAAVIGLGLIGGSVARDLAARGVRVRAYDADADELDRAVRDGVVAARLSATMEELVGAELVVIAVPVDAALDVLRAAAPHLGTSTLITDVGSTKERIGSLASALGLGDRFVGAHPMAGDHRSGWQASRAGLFAEAPLYLCPTPECTAETLALAHELWCTLGARAIEIDAARHDERLAWTSHLPHMIAVVLGQTLEAGGVSREELGPGGRDMTRIAGSSPEMWTAIAVDNAEAIERALSVAEQELAALRAAIGRRDAAALRDQFAAARQWFYRGMP
jgi:prephenate dehydrogenase